ncbi:MAG: cyanophycin synthetase, partial [Rudaea sp.]
MEEIGYAPSTGDGTDGLTLPDPALSGPCQIDNAAAAIAAVHALRERVGWNANAIASGVASAKIPARVQRFTRTGSADLIIDVAHNPQAAGALAQWLASESGHNFAVFGALQDKDVGGVITPLLPHVVAWFAADLRALSPRGLELEELLERMRLAAGAAVIGAFARVADALDAAAAAAGDTGRIVAFGSFFIAAAALEWAQDHGYAAAG